MGNIKSKTIDPKNYMEMSVPYENPESAEEAMTNFNKELGELRKKYKIPDLLYVTKAGVMIEGEPGEFFSQGFFGYSLNQLPMSAYAYGQISKESEETISKFLAGKPSKI